MRSLVSSTPSAFARPRCSRTADAVAVASHVGTKRRASPTLRAEGGRAVTAQRARATWVRRAVHIQSACRARDADRSWRALRGSALNRRTRRSCNSEYLAVALSADAADVLAVEVGAAYANLACLAIRRRFARATWNRYCATANPLVGLRTADFAASKGNRVPTVIGCGGAGYHGSFTTPSDAAAFCDAAGRSIGTGSTQCRSVSICGSRSRCAFGLLACGECRGKNYYEEIGSTKPAHESRTITSNPDSPPCLNAGSLTRK